MKSKLDSYRERNARQSSQIWSLKGQVKDLEEINASAKRISTLKDISIEMLEKEKWVLRERISEHESLQRPKECTRCQCVSKWHDQHDLFLKEKEVSTREQMPFLLNWESKTTQTQCQSFIHHLAILLSNTLITVPATEEAVRERIQDIIADEQSWISKTNVLLQEIQLLTLQVEQLHQLYQEAVCDSPQTEEKIREQKSLKFSEGKCATDDFFQGRWDLEKKKGETQREQNKMKTLLTEELDKKFTQQEKEKSQQILLSAEQSLQNPTTVSLEEKMKKLKKELSEIKLSNETMKTQLRKVIKLKDKIMKKMRESLKMVEAFKENTAQTTDCTEQEAREDIEWPIPHKAPEEVVKSEKTAHGF
ncbi:coiled-coil domain-containing protein 170-like isoform X2 [Vombatus ursinus]|uniref:coiled-coil domain-containing protein 170-like isoform X2 n=1 Tax=Vombatus ursinus TaxID=29139 RepID=UPI000FFD0C1B|nr:coiled-coil domain-containing protein 170-like isoform X2 [Vombatus ursinus]